MSAYIGAYLGLLPAQARNRALENAQAVVRQQATTQVRQAEGQTNEARRARIRLQREAAGRLRVLRAGGLGGSFRQRGINLAIDARRDLATLSTNLGRTVAQIGQQANNQIMALNNQKQNEGLAAVEGALAGIQAVASFGSNLSGFMGGSQTAQVDTGGLNLPQSVAPQIQDLRTPQIDQNGIQLADPGRMALQGGPPR